MDSTSASSTALATYNAAEWQLAERQAGTFLKSNLLPAHIKTVEAALTVMAKGRELQIPPLYALSNIGVINGKPVLSAELMLTLIFRAHGDEAFAFTEQTNERAVARYKRRGERTYHEYAWTIDDAKRAGLAGGGSWSKYPAAMLRARCISAIARAHFPDVIAGCYLPEELGADVDAETGEIIVASTQPAAARQPAQTGQAAQQQQQPPSSEARIEQVAQVAAQWPERPGATGPVSADDKARAAYAALEETCEQLEIDYQPLEADAPIEQVRAEGRRVKEDLATLVDALQTEAEDAGIDPGPALTGKEHPLALAKRALTLRQAVEAARAAATADDTAQQPLPVG